MYLYLSCIMIHNHPIIKIVQRKTNRKYSDGKFVQLPRVLQNHADPVSDCRPLRVDLVLLLIVVFNSV